MFSDVTKGQRVIHMIAGPDDDHVALSEVISNDGHGVIRVRLLKDIRASDGSGFEAAGTEFQIADSDIHGIQA